MKNQKNIRILILLILLTLAFIFANSAADREHSARESSWVLMLVQPFLELFFGKGNVTEHLVRKLAHFSEFTLLGFELFLFFRLQLSSARSGILLAVSHGLFAALTDETIQIFSHRGPQIADVWLDTSGVIFGACAGLFLLWVCRRCSANRKA